MHTIVTRVLRTVALLPDSDVRPYGLLGLGFGGVKREVRFSQSPRFDSDTRTGGLAFALVSVELLQR